MAHLLMKYVSKLSCKYTLRDVLAKVVYMLMKYVIVRLLIVYASFRDVLLTYKGLWF